MFRFYFMDSAYHKRNHDQHVNSKIPEMYNSWSFHVKNNFK